MSELKPCPICGSEPELRDHGGDNHPPGDHARCSRRGCWLRALWIPVERWQSRPVEDALREKLRVCRETLNLALGVLILRSQEMRARGDSPNYTDSVITAVDAALAACKERA